jgi:hypothetical protein
MESVQRSTVTWNSWYNVLHLIGPREEGQCPVPAALVATPAAVAGPVDVGVVPAADEDVAVDGVDLVGAEGGTHLGLDWPVGTWTVQGSGGA